MLGLASWLGSLNVTPDSKLTIILSNVISDSLHLLDEGATHCALHFSQAWDRSKAHRATTIVGATTECQHTLDDHAHLVSHLLFVFLLVQHEALVLIPLLPRLKSFIVAPTAFVAPARVPLIVAPTYTSIVGLATDWCTYTCSNSAPFPLNLLCGNVHISLLSQC
jgi:hypothetical protein